MARKDRGCLAEFVALLCVLPWWVSILVGIVTYIALKYYFPGLGDEHDFWRLWGPLLPQFSWVAFLFLVPAGISAFNSFRKARILDQQRGLDSIRALSWKEFEELLGEAFRRQGYRVRENQQGGPDGGVDLEIERDGNLYLVQCKHWKSAKVGVKIVREMLGLVTARQAQGAIIVASGLFTQEAKAFAENQPIDLVEGNQLMTLLRTTQRRSDAAAPRSEAMPSPAPDWSDQGASAPIRRCPFCAGQLVVQKARRGPQAGQTFWRCSNYPRCQYTEE